jgi:hypothetical protein
MATSLLCCAMLVFAPALTAQEVVPKQVYLIVDGASLVASNVRRSRFDELRLKPRERIRDQSVGEAVIVVATNQRIIAYGVISGWRTLDRMANEEIESIAADDYAGSIVTSERLVNFNGETGLWAVHDRRVGR